ncbi:hypothetical protein DM01DRAFT_1314427 [Hesseltinella vesiculosa]|uniref:FYR N-terminal domain-containing protein n=1 Tax=Hesseltinella vesiculosa TaxID=101127 RepID=A0A1X2GXK2_9FUNG|nr:hypothetical protein DM01DRAFT_1314427 [Hesseltinella vesiculosa]
MTDPESSLSNLDNDEHMRKHRMLKRKLIEFMNKHHEAQEALDKANRRIKALEKKNRELKGVPKQDDAEAMDISDDDGTDGATDGADQGSDDETTPKQAIKRRTGISSIQDVPHNDDGSVKLPLVLGALDVVSLGVVQPDIKGYHSERYLFPVGYEVKRKFMSMVDADAHTTYTCKIEEGAKGPQFSLCAEDAPDNVIVGKSATNVWTTVIKGVNEIRHKRTRNAISGPEYFGLSHPVVRSLLEKLEHADQCSLYKSKR